VAADALDDLEEDAAGGPEGHGRTAGAVRAACDVALTCGFEENF
jgi:hypothetical protein